MRSTDSSSSLGRLTMKRTHRSSSQSTSVILVLGMVGDCLARVEHAAGACVS